MCLKLKGGLSDVRSLRSQSFVVRCLYAKRMGEGVFCSIMTMKIVNGLLALYFFVYGWLMAFRVVPMDSFTVGCMAIMSAISLVRCNT